jgi:hypothetical protein
MKNNNFTRQYLCVTSPEWAGSRCSVVYRLDWVSTGSKLRADRTKRKEQGPPQAGRLRIVLWNSRRRVEGEHVKSGNGIGLRNTEERLKTLSGTDFEFSHAGLETGGSKVVRKLPLRRAPNLEEAGLCEL